MLLSEILPVVAAMNPHHVVIQSPSITLTYGELLSRVSSVAHGLQQLSIEPGDRIALLGNPSPDLVIAECAAIAIGAIPVTLFPSLTTAEKVQILQDADPAVIVYDAAAADMDTIAVQLSQALLVSCDPGYTPNSIAEFISYYPPLTSWFHAEPDDIALIIYTGGTTGRAKGVMHSHRSISHWSFMNPARGGGHNPAKKSLVFNQAHLTGQFILWSTLYEGGRLIYPDAYPLEIEDIARIVEHEEITFLGTVGSQFKELVQLKTKNATRIPSLQGITCGGAPISAGTFHQAIQVFPGVQILEVYSQTESGQFISFLAINQCIREGKLHRLLSVGKPADLALWGQHPYSVRIIDENGNDAAPGETGEIICSGGQMMLGYWRNSADTEASLRNGWLHTGDIGRLDEDGFLYLLDRKKDMIIVDGLNVFCAEVEAILGWHPAVLEVAVIGTPLTDEGEQVTAVIVPQQGEMITLLELQEFCTNKLAAFKIPKRLEIMDSLPKTAVGKINKPEIRKPFWRGRLRQIN